MTDETDGEVGEVMELNVECVKLMEGDDACIVMSEYVDGNDRFVIVRCTPLIEPPANVMRGAVSVAAVSVGESLSAFGPTDTNVSRSFPQLISKRG